MSAWLAWYVHSNYTHHHHHSILPLDVQERLRHPNCSHQVDFSYTMRDSEFSARIAAREFHEAYRSVGSSYNNNNNNNNTTNTYPEGSLLYDLQEILNESARGQREKFLQQRPHAVIGAARSVESSAIGYMTSALFVPQISSSSTAADLDNKEVYRSFARTITTNAGDAAAMARYLDFWNVTHVSVLYINDGYGNNFHADLFRELQLLNITTVSHPYDDLSIEASVQQLVASQTRYIVALLNPSSWTSVLRLADQYQIVGRPEYVWIFGESSLQFVSASFRLNRDSEGALARALHGSAVVSLVEQPYEPFDTALWNLTQDKVARSLYVSQHDEPEIFQNYSFPTPGRTIYQYFAFDAVTAMMLAACETPITTAEEEEDFDNIPGRRIYEQLMRTEFQGVSGHVAFDPTTGTRRSDGLQYGVRNIRFPDHLVVDDYYMVSAELTHIVTIAASVLIPSLAPTEQVQVVSTFYFASNTTIPPSSLPPLDQDLNLIPSAARIFGWALNGIVVLLSLFWMTWTLSNRARDVVKASQPIFLCQICIGTIIIASSVIPMSMQEPTSLHGLDIACMASPWLISVGFVTTFSSLFTKTWRLNKLFHNSQNFRRIVIRPKDVVLPFVVLMLANFAIMLAWTLHAPLVWERQLVPNYDKYLRNVESVGWCVPSNVTYTTVYVVLVVAINISVLLFANYQAYMARNLPSDFSESTHIAVAMGSLLEVFVLGVPLLFMSKSDPSISFLIRSILVTAISLSALLPIFVPKYSRRNINKRYNDAVLRSTGSAPRASAAVHIGVVNTRSLSVAVDSEVPKDDLDALGSGRGVSKIERNHDYFKEMEVSTKRVSFSQGGTSTGRRSSQLVENTSNISLPRASRRNSTSVLSLKTGSKSLWNKADVRTNS